MQTFPRSELLKAGFRFDSTLNPASNLLKESDHFRSSLNLMRFNFQHLQADVLPFVTFVSLNGKSVLDKNAARAYLIFFLHCSLPVKRTEKRSKA